MDELLDNAPCGFLTLTDDSEIVEINATLLKLLGYRREELIDTHVKKLFSVSGNIFYQTHFFPLLKLQTTVEEVYLPLRNKAGSEIPVLVNAVCHERQGTIFYDCVFVAMQQRHVYETDILQAKKEAETESRTREEFLSVVSHDLRTPLTAILGWVQILKSKEDDAALVKKGIEVINRSAIAQKVLIEDILDLARISSGKLIINTIPVDLGEIVTNAVEIVTSAADAKNITIQCYFAPKSIVMGDSNRLQQVLWNLLTNAIKFTPNEGRIDIHVGRRGADIELKISDTGIGISADFLPYVFDRFQQEGSSNDQQYSGLGLGLAITRHLVELHGGTIRVESPGTDKGTTFIVSLSGVDV